MNKKIISVGPFVGDFKTEILYFRPFVSWLHSHLEYESFFISSHFNRDFLYCEKNMSFIPVYECLSREELKQLKNQHEDINIKDFNVIKKELKSTISKYCSRNKSDVLEYFIPYTSLFKIPYYQRLYLPINFNCYNIENKDYVVFIPDKTETEENCKIIYNHLLKKFKTVYIVGDLKIHLLEENIISKKKDYFRNNFKWIYSFLYNSKLIICPGSHWTVLSNMQQYKTISWSKHPGLYKQDGEFYVENDNFKIFVKPKETKNLLKMIDYFANELLEEK